MLSKRNIILSLSCLSSFLLIFCIATNVNALTLRDAFDSSDTKLPLGAAADGAGAGYSALATPESITGTVINGLVSFLGVIFVCFIVYGGYLWMTAMGKEQQVAKGKDLITEAVIGLIIVVAAYAITYFIISNLT